MAAADTKEQILDVAEQVVAENGYAGTTLRNIVSKAKVNLAAVHYHFGSKEDLVEALIARIAKPIVSGQISALEALPHQLGQSPSVEALLRAYLQPSIDFGAAYRARECLKDAAQAEGVAPTKRAHFIGRCWTEPDPVKSIADQQFQESTERFLDAFQRALPNQSRSQLKWKLDLIISSLIHVLGEAGNPGALLSGNTAKEIDFAVNKLVSFLLPGLERD